MSDPAPLEAREAATGSARAAIGWIRGVPHSARRIALTGCAAALLIVSVLEPLQRQDIIDSVQFSLALFATLLTGEAVIFALSFSPSSAWPSLREIDAHIAFREWVVVGWLASMLTASGLLTGTKLPGTYGTLLFLLADAFGLFSFIRLFGLASADGRKRLLSRTLAAALVRVSVPAPAGRPPASIGPASGLQQRMDKEPVLGAYLDQIDDAAARSDGSGVRDLVEELDASCRSGSQPSAALHLIVVRRLTKAALVGTLDPVVAAAAAETAIGSLLSGLTAPQSEGSAGPRSSRYAAAVMGQASRYLAWLANVCLTLSVRQEATPGPGTGGSQPPGPPPHPARGRSRPALRGRHVRPGDAAGRCRERARLDQRLQRVPRL